MAEQYCNRTLEGFLQLARYRETFFLSLCVSNFAFSFVTSLGNILVIRALFKASSIPANEKKLFLSLAFSDLGVGLVSQLMAGIIFAAILNTASKQDYNLTSLCPTVINLLLYLFFFSALHLSYLSRPLHSTDFSLFRSICDIKSLSRLNVSL